MQIVAGLDCGHKLYIATESYGVDVLELDAAIWLIKITPPIRLHFALSAVSQIA